MFAEPLSGYRQATARPRRTEDDWAHEVAHLLDTRYAGVERITLVCDNLNTHTKGAFYEAFPPEQARDYVRRTHASAKSRRCNPKLPRGPPRNNEPSIGNLPST
jgi:plasmid stabilization system protein ParE